MARQNKKMDELFDHEYDGIQEYDNDMPRWWVGLFYATIIFSVIYLMWFHVLGIGDSQTVRYMKQVDPTYERLPEHQGTSLVEMLVPMERSIWHSPYPEVTQKSLFSGESLTPQVEEIPVDTTVVPVTSPTEIASGKQIYDQYCFTCHGRIGEGGIGPNLADQYWIHGGRFADIVHTIKVGVPIKGMIAWQGQLNEDQIIEVASYVNSLRGTDPPNAKDPQGELFVAAEHE